MARIPMLFPTRLSTTWSEALGERSTWNLQGFQELFAESPWWRWTSASGRDRPEPAPTPQPVPEAQPEPAPQPVPVPEPAPVAPPVLTPEPTPSPAPTPQPVPEAEPVPEPQPEPTPQPVPVPEPAPIAPPVPAPEPTPSPAPTPQPVPVPQPIPTPEPAPVPQPNPTPGTGTAPAGAITVSVGDDIQALVRAAPEGAVFWIEAGVHRLQSITPKDGQHFIGEEGAVLNGSRLLTSFSQEGSAWVVGGQTQEGMRNALDEASAGFDRAGYPETIYVDDQPLKHVGSRDQVAEGTFFFDYAADRIYIGTDPAGRKVEASVQPWAFEGGAAAVLVQNLTIEKYASAVQRGAIGGDKLPEGWVIQDNDIQLNYGVGIAVGSNTQVLDNRILDNGQLGLAGVGDSILVQGNEIAANGRWSGIDVLWEGGGTKFAVTEDLIVRNNLVYDNNGFGLWTDIDNFNTLYEGNRVENNTHGGIVHEISYDAVIRDNVLVGNGADFDTWLWGAGIIIQNSRNVEIYGNTVDMTEGANGISLIQQDRGNPEVFGGTGLYGEYITIGNTVRDNVIISRAADHGGNGAVADFNEAGLLAGGNSFDRNEYQVTSASDDRFAFGDWYDWDAYRAVSGWDQNSTLTIL